MAVPKKKTSKSKKGMRGSHLALSASVYIEDKQTGDLHRPHHINMTTGLYKGKKVLDVKSN